MTLFALLLAVSSVIAADAPDDGISQYLPFDMPPYSELVASPKKVFPHWHVYPISWDNKDPSVDFYNTKMNVVDSDFNQKGRERPLPRAVIPTDDWRVLDMMEEIRRAQAIGCDGFWMNHFGNENQNVDNMLEAAKRVNSEFRILLAQDVARFMPRLQEKRDPPWDPVPYYSDLYAKYGKNPFAYRVDGRLAITGFGAMWVTPQQWTQIFNNLKAEDIDVYFMPCFMSWRQHYQDYASISEGFGDWGVKTYNGPANFADAPGIAHSIGKLWIMPIAPQQQRIKSSYFEEARGSELLRNGWMTAIENDSDWVQLVTWNDYGEGTEFSPSTGTQYAYYDLCAYYNVWFKTGHAPKIVRDVLYYFHRTQFVGAPTTEGKPFECRGPKGEDIIELLAFLKEPATLKIEVGDKVYTKDAPAGITSFVVPLAYGTPKFSATRRGSVIASVTSAFPVLDVPVRVSDGLYKAGSSSRDPVPMTGNYQRFYDLSDSGKTD